MYVGLFMLPYQINITLSNSTYTYLICREFILSACQNDYITMVASSFNYLILHTLRYNT